MPQDGRVVGVSVDLRLVERWVWRRLGSTEHERRVVSIAQSLFDLLRPLHGLGAAERRLLAMAAMIHDVGRCVDEATHPTQGARMIVRDTWLPLTAAERRAMAYLTRHHRGAVPRLGKDDHLTPADNRTAMLRLLAILRAADGLDSRCLESPRVSIARHGRRLDVTCYLGGGSPKARRAYTRRKKFRLLEEELGVKVDVEVHCGDALQTV